MKEKIGRLAEGSFDYLDPQIKLSEDFLHIEASSGSIFSGSFHVCSETGGEIRAMVFSSHPGLRCLTPSFAAVEGDIAYEFDTSLREEGDSIRGEFSLVSSGGVIKLPYEAEVTAPYLSAGERQIRDLDDFTELAESDWDSALRLFSDNEFPEILLNSRKNRHIYETLKKGRDFSLAMEEFLVFVHRKKHSVIRVSEEMIEYNDPVGRVRASLVIEKEGWGYVRLKFSASGDFIKLENTEISSRDFSGSFFQLPYVLEPSPGRTLEGSIRIESFDEDLEIPVRCISRHQRRESDERRRRLSDNLISLFRETEDYEFGNMSRDRWISASLESLSGCQNNSSDPVFDIMEADRLVISGRRQEAAQILEKISERELRYRSASDYIYYLYVNACCREDEHYTGFVCDTLRHYSQGQLGDSWVPLVLLARLEKPRGLKAATTLKDMASLWGSGRGSVMLYAEALKLINMQPSLIHEAGPFERCTFIWGMRHGYISRESILHYADLSMRLKEFHREYMHSLIRACDMYESKEILKAVLHMLTLGGCRENRYNSWYRLGIESALRTRDLYENYMMSLDLNSDEELPHGVIIYFQYDNRLPAHLRARLYRYVLRHREKYPDIFSNYNGIIRAFALEQLSNGELYPDLAPLYEHYFKGEALSPNVLRKLSAVIFRHRLRIAVNPEKVRKVVLSYVETGQELILETRGSAELYPDIYLDDYRILLEDEQGGRYIRPSCYRLEKLMDSGSYIRKCYEECPDVPMVLLNRSERALKYQMVDESSINVYKRTLELEGVNRYFRKTILRNLIDYYYESYEGETLERYLLQVDISLLDPGERGNIIEYYVQRGLFDRAYSAAEEYGYENIDTRRVMRLCSHYVRTGRGKEDKLLLAMAAYAFEGGRYDEAILGYLGKYYEGPPERLYAIWTAARDFEVRADEVAEGFLCEALFAETMMNEACQVFEDYYRQRPDMRIVRAFLSFYAYRYLRDEQEGLESIFRIMEIELEQAGKARDVQALAMIKYASSDETVSGTFTMDVPGEIARFLDRGITFPFFRKAAGNALCPAALMEGEILSFRGDPGEKLMAFCPAGDNREDAAGDIMEEPVDGIYIRHFRVLSREDIPYRIMRLSSGGMELLEEGMLSPGGGRDSCKGLLSIEKMLDHLALDDIPALESEMAGYDRFDEMSDKLFHIV